MGYSYKNSKGNSYYLHTKDVFRGGKSNNLLLLQRRRSNARTTFGKKVMVKLVFLCKG